MNKFLLGVLISLIPVAPVMAEQLSGRVTLGLTDSRGNTDTTNIHGETELGLETANWKHALRARGRRVESEGEITVERYRAGVQSDYNFTEYNYFFATLDYEQDRPSGVRWRTSETVGYGRRIIKREGLSLDAEIGAGLRQSKSQEGDRDRESDTIGRLATRLVWEITEGREFSQDVLVEDGKNNTYVESTIGLRTNLMGNIYSEISYTVQRNSSVPAGMENTDRYLTASLGYEFSVP